ncbi:RNA methyltransferase [Candidatus Gracilibacteria bacterium]|nr:MAG: RNA methyltransferase [Candidatus Gracilibacteria bacterium]
MRKKIILLESIRSMQNVGAIFRNADGSGFDKLVLTGYTPYPPRNDISKTALGAENFINWEYFEDAEKYVRILKEKGYKIYSVELTENASDYRDLNNSKEEKVCLIMGNEVDGVSKPLLDLSDEVFFIPMRGKKESLNVSVAAGIVMYSLD